MKVNEGSGDNMAQPRQATCKTWNRREKAARDLLDFFVEEIFPHSFRAVVQKTRILYSQSGRKDESYSKIIQGHKYNDKDKGTDKVPEKPNMLYF